MGKYIIAHDMGTSSDKAVLISFAGEIVASMAEPYPTYYPAPSFVEQNPQDYWDAVCKTTREVVKKAGIKPDEVKGIVFSKNSSLYCNKVLDNLIT